MDDIRHERLERMRLSKAEWALIAECLAEAAALGRTAAAIVERMDAGALESLPGAADDALRKQAALSDDYRALALKVGMRMTNHHEADF